MTNYPPVHTHGIETVFHRQPDTLKSFLTSDISPVAFHGQLVKSSNHGQVYTQPEICLGYTAANVGLIGLSLGLPAFIKIIEFLTWAYVGQAGVMLQVWENGEMPQIAPKLIMG